jgi:multisubunit Na+/H+ antiporter MnhB subunit
MESKDLLRDLDLAAARPFIEYPRTPWWYPALMGGYFAAIAIALLLGASGYGVAAACVFAGAIVVLGVFFRWYRSRWGTWPQMTEAPPEIRRAYRRCLAGVSVAVVLTVIVGLLSPGVVTVAVTFLVFTTLIWGYERRVYPAACAEVRARLA